MALTRKEKDWASQHDWFVDETENGVMVFEYDYSYNNDESGNAPVRYEKEFTNFDKLYTWAGY